MRFLCDAKKFYDCIGNGEDRGKFEKKYGPPNKFVGGIYVSLPDHKTTTQLGTVWRDWTIVGRLMECSANAIYYHLMKSPECQDVFFRQDDKGNWEFETLSAFNKERTAELIERYRAVLQNWVDEEHADHIKINWSKQENINKPDVEIAYR